VLTQTVQGLTIAMPEVFMPGSRESSEAPAARDPRPGPGESAPAPSHDATSEDRADPVEVE